MTDPWYRLKQFTQARIAQGHSGCGLPTAALLDLQLAHAKARDAVHQPWAIDSFAQQLRELGLDVLNLASAVVDRTEYLQQPDKGRRLDAASRRILQAYPGNGFDVVLIISNGLSSTAVQRHGLDLLQAIIAVYRDASLRVGPICLLANARVAVADEIGALLKARLSVIMVGERPGLSAADSLGLYLTYAPKSGNTDAERNCISNIRPPEGLCYQRAAAKLSYLSREALQRGFSGVALKDEMPRHLLD